MKKLILAVLFCGLSFQSFAQNVTVEGAVKKKVTKPKTQSKPSSTSSSASNPQPPKASDKNKNFWNAETASPVFIVQNIATEKTRVYKRCTSGTGCSHELIFETDTIVGHSTSKQSDPKVFATRLGHFKIAKWTKFFEDKDKKFPAWYKDDYSVVPQGSAPKVWLGKQHLPNPEVNQFRGAYGWFTAQLGPNAEEQVIHGTYGWGADKDSFLTYFRNPFTKFIDDPMATGSTRVENQAVAYLRHLAEIGTDVLRVYALEGYADASLARYQAVKDQKLGWNWVLTTKDAQKDSVSIDKQIQQKKNYVYADVLEEGRFEADRYPTGMAYSATLFGLGAGSGTTGNTYQIKRKQFKGVFLVDEGRFVDYEHPKAGELTVGGYPQQTLPAYVQSKNSTHVLIENIRTSSANDDDEESNP
jgi:hypothetical protein